MSTVTVQLTADEKAKCDSFVSEYLASVTPEALYIRAESELKTAEMLEEAGCYAQAQKHRSRARDLELRAMLKEVRRGRRR
jgi:hypothetical protein